MAFTLLSVPTPHLHSPKSTWFHTQQPHESLLSPNLIHYSSKPFLPLSSSSSSSSSNSVLEEEPSPASPPLQGADSKSLPLRGCEGCGREEMEKGCNGKGRIQGGIAAVPGFGWWPIKAYRPCPGFVASGGRYTRQGQSMDEVVSGGGGGRRIVSSPPPPPPPASSELKTR
ncbi:unnamed protein product [Linum tenue]|uniref:Uncharacterized protein n=1 Tax=Linum tenue TaxID=586396 RepID=A0AAV0M5R3_9ROSI|nr:unnamed protein product [Linum tenue]